MHTVYFFKKTSPIRSRTSCFSSAHPPVEKPIAAILAFGAFASTAAVITLVDAQVTHYKDHEKKCEAKQKKARDAFEAYKKRDSEADVGLKGISRS